MPQNPNILLFLPDAMRADALEPGHDCLTPHMDRVAEHGVRFDAAHTSCPTCSPGRASLMTGLLPHNHGVLEVEHVRDADQCNLRDSCDHWALHLARGGYRTGYFGKWHIERSLQLDRFGWQGFEIPAHLGKDDVALDPDRTGWFPGPTGYKPLLHYAVTDAAPDDRRIGRTTRAAMAFLDEALHEPDPWCCCVSYSEPNEALVVGRDAYERYAPDALRLPPAFDDDLGGRPAIYRRQRAIAEELSESHWRQALACYYGRISELDDQLGRLLSQIERAGALENTIVVVLSDHGRYMGARGLEAHNFGAFEDIYRIPLLVAGPGVTQGARSAARVGITDVGPTLLDLAGKEPLATHDGRSFARLLADPRTGSADFDRGYAEYHGTRFPLMQRVLWRGRWKLIFNGFDFDELYDLEADPEERHNLADDPPHKQTHRQLMREMWGRIRATDDRALVDSGYYSMRFGAVGPEAAEQLS